MLSNNCSTLEDAVFMTDSALHPQHTIAEIWRLMRLKNFEPATKLSQQLCQQQPHFALAWHAACILAHSQAQHSSALKHINQALRLQPGQLDWQLIKAQLLFMNGQATQAKKLALSLATQTEQHLGFYADLALLLNKMQQQQAALDCYQTALALEPNNPQLLFNLASLQRYMGLTTQALGNLDTVIALNPNDTEAWLLRSNLTKNSPQNNHIAALQQALKQPMPPLSQAQLYYALGKEFEDCQQYPQSFAAWQQGASVRRANMQYSLDKDLATLASIQQVFNKGLFNQGKPGCESNKPIFILGLPRTGSTLVERIIGNHSQVYSAGELNNFALEMMKLVKQSGAPAAQNKQSLVAATRDLDFAQLGENYLASTGPETQKHPKFIDKLPLNSLYVGLIHLALPKAKIIYLKRHPMDSCLAIFKQIFTQGYPFSYNLEELVNYQIAHYQLMQHWQKVMPDRIHVLEYEQLVADLPGQTRALLDYCELPWQAKCCEFESNPAAATTASAAQVREPVHNRSIGKWKHYANELASAKRLFEQAGIKCD